MKQKLGAREIDQRLRLLASLAENPNSSGDSLPISPWDYGGGGGRGHAHPVFERTLEIQTLTLTSVWQCFTS